MMKDDVRPIMPLSYKYFKQVTMSEKPSYSDLEKTVAALRAEMEKLKNDTLLHRIETGITSAEIREIKKAGDKYRELYENMSDWVYIHDMNGLFIENNFHFIRTLGYTPATLEGAGVKDLMPDKLKPGFDDYLKRIMENGKDSGLMKIVAADGSERVVEYNNVLVRNDGEAPYVQGLARDITARVEAEAALKKSEQKFRSILENIYEGYYEVDLAGNFTFVNRAICSILGYTEEELLGMNNRHYMDKENARKAFSAYNRILESGEPVGVIALELIRKDGRTRSVVSSVSLITSTGKKPVGFRGIARDVTDNKRLESDIRTFRKNASNAREVTILGLAKLSEYRDDDAGAHLERMREFAKILAQELAVHKKHKDYITDKYIEDIYLSSILHDIGKVGIPDAVLLKPGKLSIEEFEIIKEHSRLGGDAIREIESKIVGESFLSLAKEIAYYHHERWNGKGYPKGLKGEEIPLSARIVALADVYDALTSKRVYKEAFTHEEAIKIIVAERGRQFDPDVVDAFMARNKDFSAIRKKLEDREIESLDMKLCRA